MDYNMTRNMEDYLELYNKLIERTAASDEVILFIMGQVIVDKRRKEIREELGGRNGVPARHHQLQLLRHYGVKYEPGITDDEADIILSEIWSKEGCASAHRS